MEIEFSMMYFVPGAMPLSTFKALNREFPDIKVIHRGFP